MLPMATRTGSIRHDMGQLSASQWPRGRDPSVRIWDTHCPRRWVPSVRMLMVGWSRRWLSMDSRTGTVRQIFRGAVVRRSISSPDDKSCERDPFVTAHGWNPSMTFLTCPPTLDPSQHPVDRCPSTRDVSRGWNPSVRMLTPPRNWGRSYPWVAQDARTVPVRAISAHRQRHPLLFDVEPSAVCSHPSVDGCYRRPHLLIPSPCGHHLPSTRSAPVLSRSALACTVEVPPDMRHDPAASFSRRPCRCRPR